MAVLEIMPSQPSLGAQSIPRVIVQTGHSWEQALVTRGAFMRTWWTLNPEYTYRFFNDSDVAAFFASHGSTSELRAFNLVKVGAMRSDLWRMLYLKN